MIELEEAKPSSIVETPQQRRERFLLEFERPFRCEKCGGRFKKKIPDRT
jgi:PHP family Zn ribbon phosphoesterase